MSDIINRQYKRKGDANSDTFIVESMEGEFVIFTNGARCKLITLVTDFEEQAGTMPVTENVTTPTNTELDPNTFFDTPLSTDNPLMDQLEQVATNPNATIHSDRVANSIDLDASVPEPTSPNSLASRMGAPTTPNTHGLNLGTDSPTPAPVNNTPNTSSEVRLPEWDVFDRVKKNDELEVMIPLTIKLPKAQKIDALDDMFDSSFIMYLAKQYIKDHVVTNPIGLQKQIQEAIEDWIEDEVYGTPKRKPASNRKPSKAKPKAKPASKRKPARKKAAPKKKVEEPVVATNTDTTANFFGKAQPKWDGDLKTLMMINTDEQYQAVKARYESILENNPDGNDRYRFEDMIEIYEMQLADMKAKEETKTETETDAKN